MSEHLDPGRYRYRPDTDSVSDIDLDRETVIIGGQRYTEADAAQDSAQFEARTRGLSRGGHSLSGDGTHSPRVTTVLPRDVHERVRERAAAEGMSVSKWVRRLVEHEVDDDEQRAA
jgi:predicted DNA binding CopG/RHH family protein